MIPLVSELSPTPPTRSISYLGYWQIPDGGQPHAVSQSTSGGYWVCDGTNHRVLKLDQSGRIEHIIGSFGDKPGCFNVPCAMFEKENHIYVCEYLNHRIQRIPLDSGSPEIFSGFSYPFNVIDFHQTHLLVAEKTANHISTISYDTHQSTTLFRTSKQEMMPPYGIDHLQDNPIIVFANDDNISCLDIHGYPSDLIIKYPIDKIDLFHIDYIKIAYNGDIYLLDRISKRLNRISTDGSMIYLNLNDTIQNPGTMLCTRNDTLIITDNECGKIHFFAVNDRFSPKLSQPPLEAL